MKPSTCKTQVQFHSLKITKEKSETDKKMERERERDYTKSSATILIFPTALKMASKNALFGPAYCQQKHITIMDL